MDIRKPFPTQNNIPHALLEYRLPILLALFTVPLGLVGSMVVPEEFATMALVAPLGIVFGIILIVHPVILLSLIVILMPIETADYWQLVVPPPLTVNKILGGALIGAVLFQIVIRREKFRFFDDTQDYAITLICATLLFSTIASPQLDRALDQIDRIFRLVVFYFAVKNLVKSRRTIAVLMIGLFATSIYASGYSINEYLTTTTEWGKRVRAAGIDNNPNNFAMTSVYATAVGYFLMRASQRWAAKAFYIIGMGVIVASIFLSASRGGSLALLAVAAVMILRHPKRIQLSLAVVSILVLSFPLWPDNLKSRYFPGLTKADFADAYQQSAERSFDRRLAYITFGLEAVSDRPIMGSGYRTFSHLFLDSEYSRFENAMTEKERIRIAHNVYLETAVGLGVVGLFAFLALLFTAWRALYRAGKLLPRGSIEWAAARGLEYALIGMSVSSLFLSSEQFKHLWFLFGMSSALLYYARTQAQVLPQDGDNPSQLLT